MNMLTLSTDRRIQFQASSKPLAIGHGSGKYSSSDHKECEGRAHVYLSMMESKLRSKNTRFARRKRGPIYACPRGILRLSGAIFKPLTVILCFEFLSTI
jgi:hypothetical protein